MKKLSLLLLIPLFFAFAEEGPAAPAPSFTLEDVDGEVVDLDALLEKGPVLISFWALWCKMCIKELDALRPFAEEFETRNITLLAISQDKTRSVPKVKPFATSHKWAYSVVLDPENTMRELYNVQAMPTFFIIDQNKDIVFTHQGYKPGDEELIMAKVRELCAESGEDEQ
jgi:peroxiredoxin